MDLDARDLRCRTLLSAVVGCSLLAGCGATTTSGSTPSASVATPDSRLGTPTDFALPASVSDARLVTSDGRTTTLAQLQGKDVVLSDTMTLCAETCPLDTSSVVQSARDQDAKGNGSKVVYVSLTVDPARDTVPQIAAYRKLFQPTPSNWLVATGATATVDALWKQLGVEVDKVKPDDDATNWRTGQKLTYDIQHSDQVFFIDTRGHVRFVLDGTPAVSASEVPTTLQKYLSDEGRKNLASPDPETWGPSDADAVVAWLLAQ